MVNPSIYFRKKKIPSRKRKIKKGSVMAVMWISKIWVEKISSKPAMKAEALYLVSSNVISPVKSILADNSIPLSTLIPVNTLMPNSWTSDKINGYKGGKWFMGRR